VEQICRAPKGARQICSRRSVFHPFCSMEQICSVVVQTPHVAILAVTYSFFILFHGAKYSMEQIGVSVTSHWLPIPHREQNIYYLLKHKILFCEL